MKKLLALFLAVMMLCSVTSALAEGKLVIYTPASDAEIAVAVPKFAEQFGVEVEVIPAGTGELLKRIEAEKDAPIADVLFDGALSAIAPKSDLFEPYISAEEDNVFDQYKNVEGTMSRFNCVSVCLLVNTNLAGDLKIEGYQDLLQPELRGKIAYTDVAASSCSYSHLICMLDAMGGGDTEEGWAYVAALCDNLDGKLLSSSSAVPRAVSDGEYVVGLTHELYAATYINSGAPVKAVYMTEGCTVPPSTVQIIKNAPNMENAKLFVDYIMGIDFQTRYTDEANSRSVRKDVHAPSTLAPFESIHVIDGFDVDDATKAAFLEKFSDLMDR